MNVVARTAQWRGPLLEAWPGLLLAAVIAIASTFIAQQRGGPTLLYALLIGMALNPIASEGRAKAGVDFAARRVLRLGVALLGARITFDQVGALGWSTALLMVGAVAATLAFGMAVAGLFGQRCRLGVLTGGATAICGASAAIAIASVLPRDEQSERELVFTVAGVTALSTLAMILYPALVGWLGLDARQAGIFLGGTIHDVAQVVGAGYSVSPEAGDTAVLTKMLRVAMLLPVVVVLTLAVRRLLHAAGSARPRDPLLPPFLVAFVVLIALASFGLIPKPVGAALGEIARACLVLAIAAVGLKTSLVDMRKVGARAAALLVVEAAFLAFLVLIVQGLAS